MISKIFNLFKKKEVLTKIKQKFYFYKNFNSKNQKLIDSFQYLQQDEIKKVQQEKLKKILKTAVTSVPFYKELNLNIDFKNFTINELKKFPIIDKSIIQKNPLKFISNKNKGYVNSTSGSSGIPFQFHLPYNSWAIETMTTYRAWGMGNDYVYKFKDPIIILRSYVPNDNEPITRIDRDRNYWYVSPFHINESNLNEIITFIKTSKSKILRGYASSIYIFTLLLINNKIFLEQIKVIVTSSEMLIPKYREVIENFFKIKVLDHYGHNESVITVQQCSEGNYHNSDDYGYIEYDDDNNIIGTSLNNNVMPFIRYNTNDRAIRNKESESIVNCLCGRKLTIPFIAIEGRSDDILIKKDGTHIPTANFSTAMKNYSRLKQFQIIQNENTSLILNIVIENPDQAYLNQIKGEVLKRLGNLELNINLVDEIKRDIKTGKVKVTIQKIKNAC